MSVNKAYISKADSAGDRTVSIIKDTDQSSNGLTVQQVILKKDEETKATFTESPFIIPDTLDAGDYTMDVTATYKGSTLSDTIDFEIIERLDTIGWLLAGCEDDMNNVQYQYNYCLDLPIMHESDDITPSTSFFPENAVTVGCTGADTIREPNYLFTHTDSDNTITEQVTVGGTTTSELLEALNAWIASQSTPSQYGYWINDTDASSPTYGYPVLNIQ